MEQFVEKVKSLSKRVQKLQLSQMTEEATKTSIIMPFFQGLGYDIFNPDEFLPEFVADVGIKKGEKVDYAIMRDGEPLILIEAKPVTEKLEKHNSQLYRYFGTTKAKFSILTNGLIYQFYTDLDDQNKMDAKPFFEFNLAEIRENQINELEKFQKSNFDVDHILTTASELKYTGEIKQFLLKQAETPTDEFVSLIIKDIYPGRKTKNVLDNFNGLVKKSFRQMINEQVNNKLTAALEGYNKDESTSEEHETEEPKTMKEKKSNIETTEEEIEGYVLIKLLLRDVVEGDRIFYRDNQSYFNVLLDDNIRKWVCRLGLNSNKKYLQLNDDNHTNFQIENISEIEQYKDQLSKTVKKFL
ncbi:MAG TPA: type I restriction endonuclease [Bacillales bacterium]|nr:type I restriction endonuclease [Bacillales bacterium]